VIPSSEFACLVGTCTNRVEDPLVPCGDCAALLGPYLQPSGRAVSAGEASARARSAAAKAARISPPAAIPFRRPGRPPRLTAGELRGEAVHLVWWCGLSGKEAAARLGVSRAAVDAALAAAGRAA
jgi:predicted DNA-binding protein (UPF0251 family)